MSNIDRLNCDDNKSCRLFASTITDLRTSQGFYSRLYNTVNEMTDEQYDEFVELLRQQDFNDTLDVIFWLEC